MIDLAIGAYVNRLSKIEERIIGIDGNGTGRIGALQRQDKFLLEMRDNQDEMAKQLTTLVHRSTSWDKATFYKNARIWIGVFLALFGAVIGYLSYRAKEGHEISKGPVSMTQSYDATIDGR